MRICKSASLCILAICCLFPLTAHSEKKPIAGWVERVMLLPEDIILHAKLDTGADTSALHATNFVEFDRQGKKWVRFTVKNRHGDKATFEREIIRRVKIKREGKLTSEVRNVIEIGVCLGNSYMETDITLVDRTHFKYQMLLGRLFLSSLVIVDPAITYNIEPRCKKPSKK